MKKAFVYLIAMCLAGTSCSLQAKTSSEQTRRHRRHQDDTNDKDEPKSKKLHKKIRKRGSAKADKEAQAKAAKIRNIQLGIFAAILVSGGWAYVTLSDPTKSPQYPQKYKEGKKMAKERIQNAINAQPDLDAGGDINRIDTNVKPVFITRKSTYCFSCTNQEDEVLKTTNHGKGSVCKHCYDEYAAKGSSVYPKPALYNFCKNLSEMGSPFYKPFDLNNLQTPNGKKTDHPAYLTTEDMAALGADKEMIKGYKKNFGKMRLIKGFCALCGKKGHIGKACPHKDEITEEISHLYAVYGGKGIKNWIQIGMEKYLDWNMSWEDERPCPGKPGEPCGALCTKDPRCNTVTCGACGVTWNWSLGYIGEKENHNYVPYRVYALKKKTMPYKSFNPNLWETKGVGKRKK